MHWILAKEPERQDVPFTCIEELLVSPQYIKHGRVWLKEKVQLSNESIKKVGKHCDNKSSNNLHNDYVSYGTYYLHYNKMFNMLFNFYMNFILKGHFIQIIIEAWFKKFNNYQKAVN